MVDDPLSYTRASVLCSLDEISPDHSHATSSVSGGVLRCWRAFRARVHARASSWTLWTSGRGSTKPVRAKNRAKLHCHRLNGWTLARPHPVWA